jgi:amidase
MKLIEYANLDATDLIQFINHKETTSGEILDCAYEAIHAFNPRLNAVVKTFDRGRPHVATGPFQGVPALVKDLGLSVKGYPLTNGSAYTSTYTPTTDSPLLTKLRAIGLNVIGKTNTSEFGLTPTTESQYFGACSNPWNVEYSVGGSSGGAAAAVASGIVPIAHATDGGGSIRIPAASCGVVGFMPSSGVMPFASVVAPFCFARHFFITKTVRDALLLFTALTELQMPAFGDTEAAAVGVVEVSLRGNDVHPEVVLALRNIVDRLADGQTTVKPCQLDFDLDEFYEAMSCLDANELAWVIDTYQRRLGRPPRRDELDTYTSYKLQQGREMSGVDMLRVLRHVQDTVKRVNEQLEAFDMLVTPVYADRIPKLNVLSPTHEELLDSRSKHMFPYTRIFNASGNPAIAIPAGLDSRGLPIGIQLVGRRGQDLKLLRTAARIADPFVRAPLS